jgi:hypothetical protein
MKAATSWAKKDKLVQQIMRFRYPGDETISDK